MMSASTIETTTSAVNDPRAHDALRAAHEGGYRFPAGFAGFRAAIVAVESAPGTAPISLSGSVTISDPRLIVVDGDGAEALSEWVKKEIASMAGHRWPTPYDQGDGRWTLSIDDKAGDPLGALITVHDDPFGSSYRVQDGRIAQVVRSMGPMTFTISMQSHQPTVDGRLLPATFTVAFWDKPSGRLTRSDIYADAYAELDGVMLPATRRVLSATDDGFVARELTLSGWTLL